MSPIKALVTFRRHEWFAYNACSQMPMLFSGSTILCLDCCLSLDSTLRQLKLLSSAIDWTWNVSTVTLPSTGNAGRNLLGGVAKGFK